MRQTDDFDSAADQVLRRTHVHLGSTDRAWAEKNGGFATVNAATRHLYGRGLRDALNFIANAHMTPWGNTRQGARGELGRLLKSRSQFESVAHLFSQEN